MTLVARSQYNNDFKLCSKDLLTSIVFVQFLVGDVFMVEELFIKKYSKICFQIQFKLHFGMEKQSNMAKGNLNFT